MFDELIHLVRVLRLAKANASQDVRSEIAALTLKLEAMNKPYEEEEASLITEWRDRVLMYGKSYACNLGKIAYRKAAVRRSWDLDKLDAACAASPGIKEAIWQYRTETKGEPSFKIETEL